MYQNHRIISPHITKPKTKASRPESRTKNNIPAQLQNNQLQQSSLPLTTQHPKNKLKKQFNK
jgi:hypothetical protein